MKKLILSAFMLLGLAFSAQAQDISKNALGLRLGDNDGFGGEISYQRGMGSNNRLEFDLGWRNSKDVDAFKLVGLYQWIWNIDGGFNWYAGAGAGVGSWSYNKNGFKDSGSFVLAAGDIGIEYNFQEAPIQLSLDFRPEFYLNNSGDNQFRENDFGPDIALGIRYRW
jgi:opacity protein-like surface antigen